MAKQSGIHKLRGKMDGVSYYRTKYVNEDLARKINTGLSQRVKTAPEYENTRLYNREFGYCAATAANMLQSVLSRYRVILNPFSQGSLVKSMRSRLSAQTGQVPLGERFLLPNQSDIDAFNQIFKSKFEQSVSPVIYEVTKDVGDDGEITYVLSYSLIPALLNTSEMSRIPNVDGVVFTTSAFHLSYGTFDDASQKYINFPTRQVLQRSYSQIEYEFGEATVPTDDVSVDVSAFNSFTPGINGNSIDGFILYATPYQVVGNEKVLLVDKASAIMLAPSVQE